MKIILDVSAAFSIITNSPASGKFLHQLASATQVLAPDLFYSEATNAAWKFHHIEDATPEESQKLAESAIQLVDIFIPSDSLWEEALKLACNLEHPTYNCFYLTLTQQQKAVLMTTDKRLIKKAKELGIQIIAP